MSQQSQSVQPSAQPSATFSLEMINNLTEKCSEFIQALQSLSQTEEPEPAHQEVPQKPKRPDQTRCYRVPGFITRYEEEALAKYRAENLLELLRKARDDFYLTSTIMRNFHEDNEINGFMIQQMGERLDYPIRMLNDLCGIFADYKPQTPESSLRG